LTVQLRPCDRVDHGEVPHLALEHRPEGG
jgi:hypothetical protein